MIVIREPIALCNVPVWDGDPENGPHGRQVGICTRPIDHPGLHLDLSDDAPLELHLTDAHRLVTSVEIRRINGALYVASDPTRLAGIIDDDEGYVALGRVIEIAAPMILDSHSNVDAIAIVYVYLAAQS